MDALFAADAGGVVAHDLTRGPWDPRHQHGGAPAALLMHALEHHEPDPGLALVRVSYDLLRPAPLGRLEIGVETTRPGRRVQLLEATLHGADGTPVVRARAQRVRRAPVGAPDTGGADPAAEAAAGAMAPPPGPETAAPTRFPGFDDGLVRFPGDGMELRFVAGDFYTPGPATVWFRLLAPLFAGEAVSPLQRLAAAADFPNGISSELSWESWVFINPDLHVFIEREPVGEWIGLTAATRVAENGGAIAQAVLYDTRGRVGRTLQTLYVAEREWPADPAAPAGAAT